MLWRRCSPCECEPPTPDCFGCSPENEPYSWDMDFPAGMTYYVADTDTASYSYDNLVACQDEGSDIEAYSITRNYPDITTLGSANICYRELSPACSWGFFHGTAHGYATKDTCILNSGTCDACSGEGATIAEFGSVSNVTNRYAYSGSKTNSAAVTSLAALQPAACGTWSSSCGGGFGCTAKTTCTGLAPERVVSHSAKFGYAGRLQYMPLTSKLVMTIRWIPKFVSSIYNVHTDAVPSSSFIVDYANAGIADETAFDTWGKAIGDVFPNAASREELFDTGTFGGNGNPAWTYSAVVDCSTDFGGTPIVLSLDDSADTLIQHYRWGMSGTPATITVTPNF